MRLLDAVVSKDLLLHNLRTHASFVMNFFFLHIIFLLFLPKFIHRITVLLQILHRTTRTQLGTPHHLCAIESQGVEPSTATLADARSLWGAGRRYSLHIDIDIGNNLLHLLWHQLSGNFQPPKPTL